MVDKDTLRVLRGDTGKREILRREGIHWETLKKILQHPEPPGYRMTQSRPKPKIGPLLDTIVASQLPVENWHENIGDPTIADAILDRLVHNAHRINLKGTSMRKKHSGLNKKQTRHK